MSQDACKLGGATVEIELNETEIVHATTLIFNIIGFHSGVGVRVRVREGAFGKGRSIM